MPPKKRKLSTVVDGTIEEDSRSSTQSVKRRKKTGAQDDPQELMQELFDYIRNYKNEEGHLLCEAFVRAPKRRTDPDYYNVVERPIDLIKIQHKLKSEEYNNVHDLAADIDLMCSNAKIYYKEDTAEYADACNLMDVFLEAKSDLLVEAFGEDTMGTEEGVDNDYLVGLDSDAEDEDLPLGVEEQEDEADQVVEVKERNPAERSNEVMAPTADGGGQRASVREVAPKITLRVKVKDNQWELDSEVDKVDPVEGVGTKVKLPAAADRYPDEDEEEEDPAEEEEEEEEIVESAVPDARPAEDAQSEDPETSPSGSEVKQMKRKTAGTGLQMTLSGGAASGRSLRERRYTYRDFLFPKQNANKPQAQEEPPPPTLPTPVVQAEGEAAVAAEDQEGEAEGDERDRDEEDTSYEQLFAAVVMAQDGERCISDMFKLLPSRKKYPDYFEVVQDPIDLKLIAQKIQNNEYRSLDEMVKDLSLMCNNAKSFNEPGSQIYRDAVTLRKVVQVKKHELDQLRSQGQRPVRSARIRERKATAGQRLSAVIAALKYDESAPPPDLEEPAVEAAADISAYAMDDDEEGADGSVMEDEDSPLWQLYRAVKNHRNSLGMRVSEPFLRLPNRRVYPDYYEEIKKPMSLLKIQKKLKNDQYVNLDALTADLDQLFENAKHYNMDESKLYKDAIKLQTIARAKRKELARDRRSELQEMWEHSSEIQKKKTGRRSLETSSITSEDGIKKKCRKSVSPEALKKRLMMLYKIVYEYTSEGRYLRDIFMLLPSKKDYPDYYHVISEPIDMTMIEEKIKTDKYATENQQVADFELMFNNARHYNEENSQVYRDADTLERILMGKVRSLLPLDPAAPVGRMMGKKMARSKCSSPLSVRLQELYNSIRDYTDSRGRTLSTPFMKLPLKSDYPDYYEVIKKPIDMQKVSQRMAAGQHNSMEDMVSDFVLMFDNACKYNEPDSLIYKDALTLQRVCLEKKQELCDEDNVKEVPDVRALVQELMTNLYISTFNHMDEEGRCYSDSFMELPSKIPVEDADPASTTEKVEKFSPTFEQVKRNLDKGRYKRLDRFQEDMFEVFEFARKVGRTDSQVFEDAVELQMFYIRIRDELCRNGDVLLSPALSYKESHLLKAIDAEKREKTPREQREDLEKKQQPETEGHGMMQREDKPEGGQLNREGLGTDESSVEYKGQLYSIGDFVYIEPRDKGKEPHIVCLEQIRKGDPGEYWFYGCWFLRPNETYHLATRKFLEKEVFKSDFYDSVPFSKIMSRCYVMFVKDYFKLRPEGIADKDVFVCESRYSGRQKAFKKIKMWPVPRNISSQLVPRDQVLTPVRVESVFAERSSSVDRNLDDGQTDALDKLRQVVILETLNAEDGYTYYEQCRTASGLWIKVGDHVYLKSDVDDRPIKACVEKIWTDGSGLTSFHGAYYITPAEVEHPPTRLFYRREVFRSSIEDTNPVESIVGRCSVLSHKDYTSLRPTELPETDIYLCEAKYVEAEKAIRKFTKPLKKPVLSLKVCDDEIYYFKKPVVPEKEPSPLLLKASEEPYLQEGSSMDGSLMETSFTDSAIPGELAPEVATPEPTEKKKKPAKPKGRNLSGYIVFAAEYRKGIANDNPDFTFGEISRVVGAKWKSLPREVKERFEAKAKEVAQEQAAKQAEADRALNDSLSSYPPSQSPGGPHGDSNMSPGGVTGTAAAAAAAARAGATQGQGQGYGHQPYPQGYPGYSQGAYPQSPYAGQRHPHSGQLTPQQQQQQGQPAMAPPPAPARPPSPIFVPVPPPTQRLLHSEAYLRYIEGLTPENRSVGDWERSLSANQENSQMASSSKLPVHWLGNGVGPHENTTSALWSLRDLMLKDALTISRTLDFSQI